MERDSTGMTGFDEGVNESSRQNDRALSRFRNKELFRSDTDSAGGDKAVKKLQR
ncbi:hypothetical protein EC919_104112 [Pseudomonas graminis]|nr:hypothetical protein EC919_104112 [Pseudomonas graminis]